MCIVRSWLILTVRDGFDRCCLSDAAVVCAGSSYCIRPTCERQLQSSLFPTYTWHKVVLTFFVELVSPDGQYHLVRGSQLRLTRLMWLATLGDGLVDVTGRRWSGVQPRSRVEKRPPNSSLVIETVYSTMFNHTKTARHIARIAVAHSSPSKSQIPLPRSPSNDVRSRKPACLVYPVRSWYLRAERDRR